MLPDVEAERIYNELLEAQGEELDPEECARLIVKYIQENFVRRTA